MRIKFIFLLMLAVLIVAGCGPRGIRYTATLNNLECKSARSLAVAVLDERPYIRNREKDPSFVGIMRGGYGNPFNTFTESGAPLADDMLATLTDSLRAGGFAVTPVKTSPADSRNAVIDRLLVSGAQRFLLMDIREWQNDYLPKAYAAERSDLFISVEISVLNRNRKVIAGQRLKEDLSLPSGWPEKTVPDVYQRTLKRLLDETRVCQALQ